MNNDFEERSPAELFRVYATLLLQWSWLLILMVLITGGTAYYFASRSTPVYQASTLVMLSGAPGFQTDPYYASLSGQQLGSTYARVITTRPVLDSVAKTLGLSKFPPTAYVQAMPDSNTGLMTVSVTDIDPARATLLANAVVKVFAEQIQADQVSRYAETKKSIQDQMVFVQQKIEDLNKQITVVNTRIQETSNRLTTLNEKIQAQVYLARTSAADPEILAADQASRDQFTIILAQDQPQLTTLQTTQAQYQQSYNSLFQSYQNVLLAEAQSTSSIIQKDPAIGASQIAPKPTQNAMVAGIAGLMLAAAIIFLIEFLDNTVRDPQDISRRWGIPVLGMIVRYKSSVGDKLITVRHPRSPVSEAFRSLRTNIQFASIATPIRTLVVTSASPSDGKTTVAANLASVIAQGGRSVVLVDADLRRPRVHKALQLSNRLGLTDQFIRTQNHFDGSIKNTDIANLHAMTSGNLPPNPSELLSSTRMGEVLDQLSNQFNTVIIDTPPTLLVTDALVLATRVDGVVLVVKPSVTKWSALKQALEQLQHVKANLLGVVINDVNLRGSRYYYYRGYYNQKYGKGYHYAEKDIPELVAESTPTASAPKASRSSALLDADKNADQKKKE